ncbi:hypothetical protein EZS27_018851 [termite gut metagenome]|uniref:Uncharacterized protein n=1 Tax=termite gut metagenome TaxID=433724 RepID=A0A5J4RGA4_9ZZZZ
MVLTDYLSINPEKKINKSDYLNLFLNIEESQVMDILKAFSFFLSSNKNHKYNITHVTDQIDSFVEIVDAMKQKNLLYKKVKKDLEHWIKLKKKRNACVLVLDQCFLCDLNSKEEVKFVENLEFFSMSTFSSKNIHIQYKVKYKDEENEYNEEYSYSLAYKNLRELLNKGGKDILEKIKLALN